MDSSDLEMVLAWRNHPEIRRYMYSQHEITLEEHSQWFKRATQDGGRHLLIFEADGMPLGFINISEAAPGGTADWGFYAAPEAPRGTGRKLGHAALRYAFTEACLQKLCGQALAYNQKSIEFHLSLGFTRERILRQQHFDGQHYHDVVCFGLLASEWKKNH